MKKFVYEANIPFAGFQLAVPFMLSLILHFPFQHCVLIFNSFNDFHTNIVIFFIFECKYTVDRWSCIQNVFTKIEFCH